MIEAIAIGAVLVLVVLTFASLLPFVPSGILASATVVGYWWSTGFTELNILVVVSLVALGLTVTATDFVSGAVAGKLGGASNTSVIVGSLIGMVLLFVVGPVGFVVGIGLTVYLISVYREDDETRVAIKKAAYTVLGVLTSKVVQFVLLAVLTSSFVFFVLV